MKKAEQNATEVRYRFEKVEKRTGALETWRTGTVKWVAGVIAVLALEGSALALYFQPVKQTPLRSGALRRFFCLWFALRRVWQQSLFLQVIRHERVSYDTMAEFIDSSD